VLVVGKSEPERIFELLGRKGEVAADRLELRDAFADALAAYRGQQWDAAAAGFERCLSIFPDDPPSLIFLARVAHFRGEPPGDDWNGVWSLTSK
jgi:adenylate cyclase